MRESLKTVINGLAVYSKYYSAQGSFISRSTLSVLAAQKYINNQEARAAQLVHILQNVTPTFLKSFWSLGESDLAKSIPSFSKIPVCHLITIFPGELSLDVGGRKIDVPIPSSHIGIV